MTKLRWGILGTARIARKNWNGFWHSGNSVLTAVASRDAQRGRQFIAECQQERPFETAPAALGSYEELLSSPNVDAVYIPLPTGLRKEWVLRAAKAKKHVLCEKPCAATVNDLREMIEACRQNHVQFMDGVMFMHNPRMNRIRQALDNGTSIGKPRRITSHFSFFTEGDFRNVNIRANGALEPLGCLGDLGWYCIRFALWAMNWQLPREVTGRILSQTGPDRSPAPVPFDFSGEMLFDGDVSSGFFCSFLSSYSNWATLSGTHGNVRVPDFVLPKSSHGALDINGELTDSSGVDPLTAQETNMVRAFADQVLSGKLNDAWPEWALKTQLVMNACLDSARNSRTVHTRQTSA
ncbi:MAG TPA: Gfo/Idh/MocA family oxidoreductase [Verrucomicrobiae bacterium]|nr:Gfo/Idh/MocA family oxidoreductase [Verrucomicrobiae bacterium]